MNIGIFGGSFNPPHNGHVEIAKIFTKYVDEVWIMPSNNPQKTYTVDYWTRFRMCNLAFKNIDKIRVSSFEQAIGENKTFFVLNHLEYWYPQHTFSFILGSDQLENLDSWTFNKNLIRDYHIYCYPRTENISKLKEMYPSVTWLENIPKFNISSSDIRNKIKNNELITEINEDVLKYILVNNFYK